MNKHLKTVFFGDVQEYLSVLAKKHNADAWLLNQSTIADFIESANQDITVYTSLGDLPKNLVKVLELLNLADIIYYCPPDQWSDNKSYDITDPGCSMQGLSETLLALLPRSIQIHGVEQCGINEFNPVSLVDHRSTDNAQLWIVGCSVSHGVGVELNQRYGALLADRLNMPVSFLTRGGSALDWSSDQICRSDIRSGDLVVWGLTDWNRLTHIHQNKLLTGVNVNCYSRFPEYHNIVNIDNLFSQQTFYNHLYSIQRAINFCNKVGAKLILVGMLHGNFALLNFLRSQKNYLHINYKLQYTDSILSHEFLDLGSDNIHPGPQQHQAYTNSILNFIQNN